MLVDCHVHLQPHGERPPMTLARVEEYARAAERAGVGMIAITEHLFRFEEAFKALHGWWDDDPDPQLAELARMYWEDHVSGSVVDYVRVIEEAKGAGLPVLLGIEMDWIDGRGEQVRQVLAPYDWDIVLGSVHYVGAWGIDDRRYLAEWERRDVAGAWGDYAALVADLAASGLADVLAHPDLPKIFGHRPADETPLHAAVVEGAAAHGSAIEINTNGLRRCGELYPAPPLLERARARGLPVTFASDAHTPERIGADFAAAAAAARAAGYEQASYYERRRRVGYPIAPD
jgi:histidinol-phosphatase (PHP family)